MRRVCLLPLAAWLSIVAAGCSAAPQPASSPRQEPVPQEPRAHESAPQDRAPQEAAPHEAGDRFVVVGDLGAADDRERRAAERVREWVLRSAPRALVTTGDNAAKGLERSELVANYRRHWGWAHDAGLQVVASLGDNDRPHEGAVKQMTGMPGNWYRVRHGRVELFVLDTNRADDAAQTRWLDEALASSDAAWKVAVFHEPPYSCSGSGGRARIRREWVPLLERHGVALVLNGHHHSHQHFAAHNGVTYVIASGTAAPLHRVDPDACPADGPPLLGYEDDAHKLYVVTVTDDQIRIEVVGVDSGEVLRALEVDARTLGG